MVKGSNLVGLEGLIERHGDYRDDQPYIAGTGVSVRTVSLLYGRERMTADEIADEMGLSREQAYAALAFYFRNKVAMDAEFDALDAEEARLESTFGRKGRAHRAS